MLIILAPLAGLFLLWLMVRLATYALPFAAGVWSAFWLLHHGNTHLISILGGFAAGVAVLATGQVMFATVRSPAIRFTLVGVFALPAGIAGYNLVYSLGRLAAEPGPGLTILSVMGGAGVAIVASTRLANRPAAQSVRAADAGETA